MMNSTAYAHTHLFVQDSYFQVFNMQMTREKKTYCSGAMLLSGFINDTEYRIWSSVENTTTLEI